VGQQFTYDQDSSSVLLAPFDLGSTAISGGLVSTFVVELKFVGISRWLSRKLIGVLGRRLELNGIIGGLSVAWAP